MNLKNFIERPVLASVISVLIVIAGIIGLASLPVEQYPDIAPPTVMVSATYPGASAETIQKSVIVPLEEQINGVENMQYITSTASSGSASIQIIFRQGTDPDMAAVNVQNKVAIATLFCTFTAAISGSVPCRKMIWIEAEPDEAVEVMYCMFSTPLICSSSGTITDFWMVSALAPG